MLNAKTRALFLTVLCIFCMVSVSHAQQTIRPEKRALIKELLDVTGGRKTTENVFNALFAEMDQELPKVILAEMQGDKRLAGRDKEELQKEATEVALRVSKRFRELLFEKVHIEQFIEDLSYPLYDKYFTEDELKDLIIFYKSSTGKKAISVMPALLTESIAKSNEVLLPIIRQVVQETSQDELDRYIKEKNINSPKP